MRIRRASRCSNCSSAKRPTATSTRSRGTRTCPETTRTRASGSRGGCSTAPPLAAELVRDRKPPVPAERLRAHLDSGRSLAALVLGPVDEADHLVDDVLGKTAADQLLAALVLLDLGLEDLVE